MFTPPDHLRSIKINGTQRERSTIAAGQRAARDTTGERAGIAPTGRRYEKPGTLAKKAARFEARYSARGPRPRLAA